MFIRLRCFEKSPENQANTLKRAYRPLLDALPTSQQGSSANGGRPWPSLADTEARPPNGRAPVRLGDPLLGPRQPVSSTSFDVSRCLEGQTTSEEYEAGNVVFVSKIASHWFENHLHTTSVLREKPRKQRKHAQKSEPTPLGRPPSPPTGELGQWGSAMAEPRRH